MDPLPDATRFKRNFGGVSALGHLGQAAHRSAPTTPRGDSETQPCGFSSVLLRDQTLREPRPHAMRQLLQQHPRCVRLLPDRALRRSVPDRQFGHYGGLGESDQPRFRAVASPPRSAPTALGGRAPSLVSGSPELRGCPTDHERHRLPAIEHELGHREVGGERS